MRESTTFSLRARTRKHLNPYRHPRRAPTNEIVGHAVSPCPDLHCQLDNRIVCVKRVEPPNSASSAVNKFGSISHAFARRAKCRSLLQTNKRQCSLRVRNAFAGRVVPDKLTWISGWDVGRPRGEREPERHQSSSMDHCEQLRAVQHHASGWSHSPRDGNGIRKLLPLSERR